MLLHACCCTQLVPTEGASWKVYWRAKGAGSTPPTIEEVENNDPATLCQSYDLQIKVQGSSCPSPSITGTALSCEDQCALVRARPGRHRHHGPCSVRLAGHAVQSKAHHANARNPWRCR